jgi:hypothetical protein
MLCLCGPLSFLVSLGLWDLYDIFVGLVHLKLLPVCLPVSNMVLLRWLLHCIFSFQPGQSQVAVHTLVTLVLL